MFKIDIREIIRLEHQLRTFNDKAYPFATRFTIHQAATQAKLIAREIISEKMVNRNAFTRNSIQVHPRSANKITLRVSAQEAFVGSTADYMKTQEFGGSISKTGKRGVNLPTSYSAGQGLNAQPRTKLPTRANKMKNIRLKRVRTRGSRKQRNLVAIKLAAKTGNKYIFLDLGRRQGIFKVIGGKRRPQLRMVHDLSHKTVDIPRRPWLAPAEKEATNKIPGIYVKSLKFQLKRLGLF